MNKINGIIDLSVAEMDDVNGGCDGVYNCFKEGGKWVANKIEDGVDAAVAAGKALYDWANS